MHMRPEQWPSCPCVLICTLRVKRAKFFRFPNLNLARSSALVVKVSYACFQSDCCVLMESLFKPLMVLVVTGLCTGKMMSLIFHVEASLVYYVHNKTCNICYLFLFYFISNDGNRTEWSPIQSVIIRVITKSDDRAAGVRFVYHEYDYRLNWTTRSPIIN